MYCRLFRVADTMPDDVLPSLSEREPEDVHACSGRASLAWDASCPGPHTDVKGRGRCGIWLEQSNYHCTANRTRHGSLLSYSLYEQCSGSRARVAFEPGRLLTCLRNTKLLMIFGDSISRMHFGSLSCAVAKYASEHGLSMTGLPPDMKKLQVEDKYSWHIPQLNLSAAFGYLGVPWMPWDMTSSDEPVSWKEVQEMIARLDVHADPSRLRTFDNGTGTGHLDVMFDICGATARCVAVVNNGHRMSRLSFRYHQVANGLLQRMLDAQMLYNPNFYVIWRSFAPRHYMGGEWDKGGTCADGLDLSPGWQSKLLPTLSAGDQNLLLSQWDVAVNFSRSMRWNADHSLIAERVAFVDVTRLSWERPDAHIADNDNAYQKRFAALAKTPNASKGNVVLGDCSHYCHGSVPQFWSMMIQHTLCRGSRFDFSKRGCESMESCPRGVRAALQHAVAAKEHRVGPTRCVPEALLDWKNISRARVLPPPPPSANRKKGERAAAGHGQASVMSQVMSWLGREFRGAGP